jgi:3-oxoacyl-[acyl-carrier protein] reductase
MLLDDKIAVVYGAAGAIGSVVSRTFAREGAHVFLTGRTLATLDAVARDITDAGGRAQTARVDALDEHAIDKHLDEVVERMGRVDVSFNLISIPHVQGTPLVDLPTEDFTLPVMNFSRTHLLTARAAARHMVRRGSGVILMMTTTPARMAYPWVGPFGAACGAIEGLAHTLAAELGSQGIRVVCLVSTGSPNSKGVEHVAAVHARAAGATRDQWLDAQRKRTLLQRMTNLTDVGNMAALIASDRASAVTGTAVNLTCGLVVD